MAKENNIPLKDAYTYFVISENASLLEIPKMHLCFWWYKKRLWAGRKKLLEIGLQIKVSNIESLKSFGDFHQLKLDLVVPWLRAKTQTADLYNAIRNTKNARFIFNEDVNPGRLFDGGDGATGQILNFTTSSPLCVLPTAVECEAGVIHLCIDIPDTYTEGYPIYVRFVVAAERSVCYAKNGFSKSLYSYDIKINEPRNLPQCYKKEEMCTITASYCFHMVPSHYQVSFVNNAIFQNIRILEHNRYVDYVSGISLFKHDIAANEFQVLFNKISDGRRHSFFTSFESEHIGMTPIVVAAVVNILCALALLLFQHRAGQNQAGGHCGGAGQTNQRDESLSFDVKGDCVEVDPAWIEGVK